MSVQPGSLKRQGRGLQGRDGTKEEQSAREPPREGNGAELYLHNALTFLRGTCGAIPEQTTSPPLMVRAFRAAGPARSRHLRRRTPCSRWTRSPAAHPRRTGRAGSGGASGSRRSSFFPAGRSADVSRSGHSRRGRHLGAGAAASRRCPGLPSVHPPGRQARCPAGRLLCARAPRDSAPARSPSLGPALRPFGMGPPERTPRQTRRCTRAHTVSHAHTHTMPPRSAHLTGQLLGFTALGAIPFPPSGERWVTSRGARTAARNGKAARVPVSGRRVEGWSRATEGAAGSASLDRAQVPLKGGPGAGRCRKREKAEGGRRRRRWVAGCGDQAYRPVP